MKRGSLPGTSTRTTPMTNPEIRALQRKVNDSLRSWDGACRRLAKAEVDEREAVEKLIRAKAAMKEALG